MSFTPRQLKNIKDPSRPVTSTTRETHQAKEQVVVKKGFTDIMMGLGLNEMRKLRKEFDKHEEGLSMHQVYSLFPRDVLLKAVAVSSRHA